MTDLQTIGLHDIPL